MRVDLAETGAVAVVLDHPDERRTEILDHHADAKALCTRIACRIERLLSGEDFGGPDQCHGASFLPSGRALRV